jgi:hypothetical protein
MNTTATYDNQGASLKRRTAKENQVHKNTIKFVKSWKLDGENQIKLYKLVSSFVVVLMGFAGYFIAGLL